MREDGNAVYETLQEIKGDMIIAGLKFNKTTHALFVEVHLLTGQVEVRRCPLFWTLSSLLLHDASYGGSEQR